MADKIDPQEHGSNEGFELDEISAQVEIGSIAAAVDAVGRAESNSVPLKQANPTEHVIGHPQDNPVPLEQTSSSEGDKKNDAVPACDEAHGPEGDCNYCTNNTESSSEATVANTNTTIPADSVSVRESVAPNEEDYARAAASSGSPSSVGSFPAIIQVDKWTKAHDEAAQFHPTTWSVTKRSLVVVLYSISVMLVNLTITTYASSTEAVKSRFGGSDQKILLGQSLFIVGTALAPYVIAPISDTAGRKRAYVPSLIAYAVFNIIAAFATSLNSVIALMFLAGMAASTPICLGAAVVADVFGSLEVNAQAMACFVVAANIGPSIGSPIGAWLTANPHLGYQWIFLMPAIFAIALSITHVFIPETLPNTVMRNAVPNNIIFEEPTEMMRLLGMASEKIRHNKTQHLTQVSKIISTEPTIFLMAICNGFAYGVMFLFLQMAPIVYMKVHGLSAIEANLTYLSFAVSVILMFFAQIPQDKVMKKYHDPTEDGPEHRLPFAVGIVWLFPVSLLWFGFTSGSGYSIWLPIVAGGLFGFANPVLWNCMLTYVADTYISCAGSAIAAFQIPSFLITAAFPHIGLVLFDKLSIKMACVVLAAASVPMCLIVFVIFRWGSGIRVRTLLANEEHRKTRNPYQALPVNLEGEEDEDDRSLLLGEGRV